MKIVELKYVGFFEKSRVAKRYVTKRCFPRNPVYSRARSIFSYGGYRYILFTVENSIPGKQKYNRYRYSECFQTCIRVFSSGSFQSKTVGIETFGIIQQPAESLTRTTTVVEKQRRNIRVFVTRCRSEP